MTINITTTLSSAKHIKCLVYGESGMGKTVLCSTTPNPIIISAEAGLMSLSGKDIPVIEVHTIQDVQEAYEYVEGSEYETVCLDSISEIAEVILEEEKKLVKDGRKAYAKLADAMIPFIRNFRDLEGKHVYFTAKQRRLEDKNSGIVSYVPSLPGRLLPDNIEYFFDIVMCMRVGEDDEGDKYRYLMTQPDGIYKAKDRSGKLDVIERPDLGLIFNKIVE